VFVVACLLVAGVAGLVVAAFISSDSGAPKKWDKRVTDLVAFVEQATGKTFDHPVRVRFLSDADFEKLVTVDAGSLTEAQKQAFEHQEAVGRAFGWFSGDTKIFDESNQLNGAGILAFYSYQTKEIVARTEDPSATTLSVNLRSTLVHELTHTMQDQRFGGIDRIRAAGTDDERSDAITSLIEGHATYVEDLYIAQLSPQDYDAYVAERRAATAEIGDATSDVPQVLSIPSIVPYVFGPDLVEAAVKSPIGIQGLFDAPPVAMDQVLDPRAYFAHDTTESIGELSVPGIALETETMGSVKLYLTLAQALSPEDAFNAALTWGNDSYKVYTSSSGADAKTCVHWYLVADAGHQAELTLAITAWAAKRPAGADASVSSSASQTTVDVCDPGTSVTQALIGEAPGKALFVRGDVLGVMIERTGNLDAASCVTDQLFEQFSVDDIAEQTAAVTARIDALVASCA
jgi:hypothetical protein